MLTRRTWLAGAAFHVFAADAYAGPIVDTHVHFYDPGRVEGVPWPPAKDALLYRRTLPVDFRAAVKGLGMTGVVVVEASPWVEDNQWMLDLAKDEPSILGVVGNLQPGSSEFARNLARFSRNALFRGIRIRVESFAEVRDLRRVSDAGLQVDVLGNHTMLEPLLRLTEKLPRLRIVVDHLPFDRSEGLRELGKRPNVYAKVSGVLRASGTPESYQAALDELWQVFGQDRLIYGSNWPFSNRLSEYTAVLSVVKDCFERKGRDAAERFFVKNARRAYRWPRV